MDKVEIKYKTNFFSKEKTVVFDEHSISLWCNQKKVMQFEKESIKSMRFGIKWITGFEFTVGRIYCFDILNDKKKVMKIRIKTFYGINKKSLNDKYSLLIDHLFDFHYEERVKSNLNEFYDGNDVEIAQVVYNQSGVCLNTKNKAEMIEWGDLFSKSYFDYYALASVKNPTIYRTFNYLKEWDAVLIYSFTKSVLEIMKNQSEE